MKFHHFGLAVHAPESAFDYLAALGYSVGESVFDPLQGVNLAMCHHPDMPAVELIWPGNSPSPIDALLKRNDALIYHLCYTTDDAAASLAALEARKLRVLNVAGVKPAVLFGGVAVSFHHVGGVGLIELIHGNVGNSGPHAQQAPEQ
jgi:hypothetical protein